MKPNSVTKKAVRLLKKVRVSAAVLAATAMTAVPAYAADSVQGSKLVTGTEKLIGDVTTWLMVLAPVVAGLLIIYFCIRRSAADEMDTKKWNNRITVAIVSCIGAVLGSATLNLIIGYYK
ncbi:Mbov_0395 family pilin-like conjugal transfer protein [Dehalobacter restrictus]|jgi:ABC-type molybdate transport system permease subunit|uniref:Mbov_0395 family pilin-like conjugal transfer protein n=1 Tax=Dehalobacter restrictus TaxID=55583 RepID=UPI00338E4B9F